MFVHPVFGAWKSFNAMPIRGLIFGEHNVTPLREITSLVARKYKVFLFVHAVIRGLFLETPEIKTNNEREN